MIGPSLLICLALMGTSPSRVLAEDGSSVTVDAQVEPVLFTDLALPTLISEKPCCDPLLRPDGTNGNPICFEGSACCPDGTWSCSIGDGKTFPCGGENVMNPKGKICDEKKCCPTEEFPLCFVGTAQCCPDGTWSCPNGNTNIYICGGVEVTGPTKGRPCDDKTTPSPTPRPTKWKYISPNWWDLIAKGFDGNHLKKCGKRQKPPTPGSKCSRRLKTCFFGEQVCPDPSSYPELQCDCRDAKWACKDVTCPGKNGTSTGRPNACPYVNKSPAACPADNPLFADGVVCESASLIGQTCYYGEESCCGNCFASIFCSCSGVGQPFACGYTDACFFPRCMSDTQMALWDSLVGTVCDPDAINAILADYPDMQVSCIPDDAFVTADYNGNRVRIRYDAATGLVSQPPRVG